QLYDELLQRHDLDKKLVTHGEVSFLCFPKVVFIRTQNLEKEFVFLSPDKISERSYRTVCVLADFVDGWVDLGIDFDHIKENQARELVEIKGDIKNPFLDDQGS